LQVAAAAEVVTTLALKVAVAVRVVIVYSQAKVCLLEATQCLLVAVGLVAMVTLDKYLTVELHLALRHLLSVVQFLILQVVVAVVET
jgi:hypothetical protein